MISQMQSKRQKVAGIEDVAIQMWDHYRNYLDSLENDPLGDIDELQEMIDISKGHVSKSTSDQNWDSVLDLLPMLVSMGFYHLAESNIAEYLQPGKSTEELAEQIQKALTDSLEYLPKNAATWSMGGNFGRMTQRLSLSTARKWYERAAEFASELRTKALQLLNNDHMEDSLLKEWVELLVLNQIVGVEFQIDDDVEATTNQEEIEDEEADHTSNDENDDAEGHYSASAVEGTSRFMCSMLGSIEGKHDLVMNHLKYFGFTHRLHPEVWNTSTMPLSTDIPTQAPLTFTPKEGILPAHLYENLKEVFAPDAPYWTESNYIVRGYYSYFMDYDAEQEEPRNLIEDVIVKYLLPRAKQVLNEKEADSICGFEWWTHTRPIQANLGHNLHFDTDESLLAHEKKVTHPILSSVLYLTGGGNGDEESQLSPAGATIILDQTPDAEQVASRCWKGFPVNNSFLIFPGNLLHGVLPCMGEDELTTPSTTVDLAPSTLWKQWNFPGKRPVGNRLTFMVGFWTRNVPKTMKERHLYGPCGPLPPSTKEHSWVQQISKGYDEQQSRRSSDIGGGEATSSSLFTPSALPQAYPAWEPIPDTAKEENGDQTLIVPPSIDHRFFVEDAPRCFYNSLFEEDGGPPVTSNVRI